MTQTYLIHYGEIGLKGKNRKDFEFQLKRNIKAKLQLLVKELNIEIKNKYLTLDIKKRTQKEEIIEVLETVFGIKWFAPAQRFSRDTEIKELENEIFKRAKSKADSSRTFRIYCKRADKTFPQKSDEIEKRIGERVIKETDYNSVSLTQPQDTFSIEINPTEIFLYDEKIPGPGGLPVGSNGRVLVLLSGGIDSPVAAYMMAKRGCSIDFLHFYVNEPDKNSKIVRLTDQISRFTGKSRLYLAPYLPFNMAIMDVDTEYELVLFRRFTFRVAENLCREKKIDAIATGDNLGQVASQTVENLKATNDALEETACFRPLVGMDKEEIIKIAKLIGTYEISIEPHKDCCSIIDRHARTRVEIDRIREEEKKIVEYKDLLTKTKIENLNP